MISLYDIVENFIFNKFGSLAGIVCGVDNMSSIDATDTLIFTEKLSQRGFQIEARFVLKIATYLDSSILIGGSHSGRNIHCATGISF